MLRAKERCFFASGWFSGKAFKLVPKSGSSFWGSMAGTPSVFAFFHWAWAPGGRPERVQKKRPNAVFHCLFIFRLPGPSALDSKGSLLKTLEALLRNHFGPQSSTDTCSGHLHQTARKGHKSAFGISILPRKT